LSQAAFCRREGILEWQLSSWKCRELRIEGKTPSQKAKTKPLSYVKSNSIEFAAVDEPALSRQQERASTKPAKFVPLVPEKEESAGRDILRDARRTPVAEICFGEVSVRIWRGADQETMRLVLNAVKEFYSC
jgi:hypothetical protein